MPKNTIPVNDDDFGAVCNCAIRYCLGRMSYMPGLVIDFIKPLVPNLSTRALWCMRRDIEEAEGYGDEQIDKPRWMDLLAAVKSELVARGETMTFR